MVFLCTIVALPWNFVAVLIGTIASSDVTISSCFFAILYMVIGIPGAWYTWYVCCFRLLPQLLTTTLFCILSSVHTFEIHLQFIISISLSDALVITGRLRCRYGRLYAAMQTDGALSFAGFFFTFFIHTAFAIWSAISPDILNGQDYAHTGWLPALSLFKSDSRFAGIMYMVGMHPTPLPPPPPGTSYVTLPGSRSSGTRCL